MAKKKTKASTVLTLDQVCQVVRTGPDLGAPHSRVGVRQWMARGVLTPALAKGRGFCFSPESVLALLGGWKWEAGRLVVARTEGDPAPREALKEERKAAVVELMKAEPTLPLRQIGIRLGIGWATISRYWAELKADGVAGRTDDGWVVDETATLSADENRRQYLELLGELHPELHRLLVPEAEEGS